MQATIRKGSRFRSARLLCLTCLALLKIQIKKSGCKQLERVAGKIDDKKFLSVSLFGQRNYRRVCAKVFITAIWRTQMITSQLNS